MVIQVWHIPHISIISFIKCHESVVTEELAFCKSWCVYIILSTLSEFSARLHASIIMLVKWEIKCLVPQCVISCHFSFIGLLSVN